MASGGRSNADETLAANIAVGKTVADAAALAGVAERTAHRLADPQFAARVRELRAAMVAEALGRMTAGMTAAADALNDLVQSPSPDCRFKAAKAVLELALKLREQTDLEERLAEVERQIAEGTDGVNGNNG